MTKSDHTAKKQTDIVIIGGGHAGLITAALIGQLDLNCILIDRDDPQKTLDAAFDGRTTAISYGSQKVLQETGAWEALEPHACPIEKIDILDGNSRKNILEFDNKEVGGDIFGWILENRQIRLALYKRLEDCDNVTIIAPSTVTACDTTNDHAAVTLDDGTQITAKLLIGADGRGSFVRRNAGIESRQWSYNQHAIVCTVVHEHPHDNIAVEHFRNEGPFAILPMTDDEDGHHRSSIVWTEDSKKRQTNSFYYDDETFNYALQSRFPDRYGTVKQIGKRFSFPLSLNHAYHYTSQRTALVADAAHGIHPIAGQGLNLGIRDIAALYGLLAQACDTQTDIGSDAQLQRYEQARRLDNTAMAGTTDILNKLFSNDSKVLGFARKAGMHIIAKTPPAKRFFMKQAMGSAGILPALIKDTQ